MLEELASAAQNVVERILKVRRSVGEFTSHLLDILLVAFLDLVAKELTQRSVAQAFFALLRVIGDKVGHKRPRQTSRALPGIGIEKRIDWPPAAGRRAAA